MRVAFVGGSRWSAGTGRVPNRSVLVDEGRIVGIDVDPSGAATIELGSRLLVPGFVDAHVHPMVGGLRILSCDLTEVDTRDEAERRIAATAAALPPGEWLTGGGWLYDWYHRGCPSARLLDRLAPDRPAAIKVRDGHSIWVNSKALSAAGVTADTPDPPDGRIEREPDGSPQGTLHEGAMRLVESLVPPPDPAQAVAALRAGADYLHRMGVTSWQDAWVTDLEHSAYRTLEPHSVVGALWWDRSRGIEQVAEVIERSRERMAGYRPHAVKLMLDGVCENFTAAMTSPYDGPHGLSPGHAGTDFIEPGLVAEAVTAFDAAGLQCHFHAIGDRAVRSALDAVAAGRTANGWSGPIHHIAHIQVIHPEDLRRFADLRVAANCQPLWACNDTAMLEMTVPYLGAERARWQYPFGALARSGALLAMGCDWPVSTGDVMQQVSVAVRRRPPGDDEPPIHLPEQRLTLDQALTGFTLGSAIVNGVAARTGRIRLGNVADLAVLDTDPFRVDDPAGIVVDLTIVAGEIVWDRKEGS
ncbi:MAG TPA: amidohydrolase [Acidimicrobiia bacterium]|nr:amidohydrolase [Acidimicrobiia bacterium]